MWDLLRESLWRCGVVVVVVVVVVVTIGSTAVHSGSLL